MSAGKYALTVEQGATFELSITYKDSTGTPINLTNYGARMQFRSTVDSSVIIASLTSTLDSDGSGITITAASGALYIRMSAASSSALNFSNAVYDLEVYSGSGNTEYVQRILEGRVKLNKNVTR